MTEELGAWVVEKAEPILRWEQTMLETYTPPCKPCNDEEEIQAKLAEMDRNDRRERAYERRRRNREWFSNLKVDRPVLTMDQMKGSQWLSVEQAEWLREEGGWTGYPECPCHEFEAAKHENVSHICKWCGGVKHNHKGEWWHYVEHKEAGRFDVEVQS